MFALSLSHPVNEINEALGQNFSTPEGLDEADLDAELEMLGDELEELEETADTTPSYLLPAMPSIATKEEEKPLDEYGLPSAPIGQKS